MLTTLDILRDARQHHQAGRLSEAEVIYRRLIELDPTHVDRDDCPWYPSLRQFRQPQPGDWDTAIARVAAELAQLAGSTEAVHGRGLTLV